MTINYERHNDDRLPIVNSYNRAPPQYSLPSSNFETLQHELIAWKKKYAEAVWKIDQLKNENGILQLEVSVWQARFLVMKSRFSEMKRKFYEFSTWFDPDSSDED
jgi:hypothetical protein